MKKMLSLILALVLVLGMLPVASAAEVVASGHDWRMDWVLTSDGTLTISGWGMKDDEFDYVSPWYKYVDEITTIVIEEGVYSIERFAFTDFENVTEVTLPETLESIGMSAFAGCSSLKHVYLPAAVRKINDMAFASCASLTMLDVAEDNAHFSDVNGVLMDKNQETLIQVPAGTVGVYAVPDSVKTVQRSAFMDCEKLTSVSFPDHLTELPNAVLYDLDSLTSVRLPAELTTIPESAFYGTPLTYVEIPSQVSSIEIWAFGHCFALEHVIFTSNAPTIHRDAFQLDTLTAWYPTGNNTWTEEVMQDYVGTITWKSYEPMDFNDVFPYSFYYNPVLWAVNQGITSGTSDTTFSPAASCNRAQAVTFLWAAAGKPEPALTEHSFVDVPKGSFCEKAVLWAVEKGITTGTDETHFSPLTVCNRATIVTFLYKALGSPEITAAENPFEDIPAESWYTAPVLWALENGITSGTDATHFTPAATCIRAQMVTFLHKAYNK